MPIYPPIAAGAAGATGATGPAGTAGPGNLIAVQQYAPSGLTTYTTTAAAMVAIDTTNLTVSPVVPASGNILVRFESTMQGSAGTLSLALLNHSGGAQIGNTIETTVTATSFRLGVGWYLTGLTPGALGIDIAFGIVTGGTGKVFAQGHAGTADGNKAGPALITVYGN